MRRRSTRRKASTEDLLTTPLPDSATAVSPIRSVSESPKEFEFNLNTTKSSASMRKKSNGGASASNLMQPTGGSSSPSLKGINTVSDLKQLALSQLESLKRQLERSNMEISKEIEASQSRLQKRFKIQSQACHQVMDEADIDYKKILERINEGWETMNASFTEFIAEVESSAAHSCKTSIPDISKSFQKSINSVRSRYGISSTSVSLD